MAYDSDDDETDSQQDRSAFGRSGAMLRTPPGTRMRALSVSGGEPTSGGTLRAQVRLSPVKHAAEYEGALGNVLEARAEHRDAVGGWQEVIDGRHGG